MRLGAHPQNVPSLHAAGLDPCNLSDRGVVGGDLAQHRRIGIQEPPEEALDGKPMGHDDPWIPILL